ncbi:metal ABC transporter solute-binding protein, Zn/Mn family [Ovoidimarina sediminis]|uniref:metal ABC transporter solute-binding protein, Zn/Mn family n=1 Tax=Ovoidimarina sediminis TaxID=3079856 RepID=UPI00290CCA93|nr:zinc ABC transporter substrate-binding protein [Rhodophyticola sp. MJ-SS7]MDU8943019.1 zinc ABC transporter substrate-binding protein [Rhodophyticola sp. MJ-SS7]
MRFVRRHVLAFAVAALATVSVPAWAEERISVVATTGMIADTARAVGGDLVDVRALMGPGVDPHAYRQTRTDIVAMTRADIVLWHGLYLEAQMEDFFHDLDGKRPVIAVGEAVPEADLLAHEDYEGRFDPHVWMDPDLWTHVVIAVRDALTGIAPEHGEAFAANTEAHLAELQRLGTYSEDALATVPEASRVLVTAHDAFRYFGEAYGFEVLGIQGISTESEAGLNRIAELVDLLVERKIGAVFVESSVSDRNIRALIEGAASRGHSVKVGGELYSDAMGADGSYEGTWIGMIDHNVTTIAGALGGVVAERGMDGRLSAGF